MEVIHKYLNKIKDLKEIVSFVEKCTRCSGSNTHVHTKKRMMCRTCGKTFNKGLFNTRTVEAIMFHVLKRNNVYIHSGNPIHQVNKIQDSLLSFKEIVKNNKNTYIIVNISCDKTSILNPMIYYFVIEKDEKRIQKDREEKLKRLTNEN